MIRAYEKDVSWRAGALAIGVHVVLLAALLISFNWKAAHSVLNIAEVELWDSLPNNSVPKKPERTPKPTPEPVVKEMPKPEPIAKEKPVEAPKVDIALVKKKQEPEQIKLADQVKKDKALEQKKQLDALKDEISKDQPIKDKKPVVQNDALKKLQQEALADDKSEGDKQAVSAKAAANAGVLGDYINKIQAKIRSNVNKTLCGEGNPELKFDIALLPTGQLSGSPKLIKSSGSGACDEAVERAIIVSEPLPLPEDKSLFSQFRSLKLKFRPND